MEGNLNNEYRSLKIFISQDFDSLDDDHFIYVKELVDILFEVSKNKFSIQLTSGKELFSNSNYRKNFEENFHIPFCSTDLKRLRINQLLEADLIVCLQTSRINNFTNFELGYNLNKPSILPMFILFKGKGDTKFSPFINLDKSYPKIPIKTLNFDRFDHIKSDLYNFLEASYYYKHNNIPKLVSKTNEHIKDNETKKEENDRIGQFPYNNINVINSNDLDELKKATLILKSGKKMKGFSFGAYVSRSGETVFHTSMTGYPECLSDPSFRGQILVCSSVILGQYGVPEMKRDRYNLLERFESEEVQISGLIITDYSFNYSHFQSVKSLSAWLTKYNVPAIYGWEIDTRYLITQIREVGSMMGKIVQDGTNPSDIPFFDPNISIMSDQVCVKKPKYFPGTGQFKVILIDFGVKQSMIRCLLDRSLSVLVVPWDWDIENETFNGIVLSNGPGDPKLLEKAISTIRNQMKKAQPKPIFGINMGHQIIALAAGGKSYKLAYGNRGHNEPVVDVTTGRTYITSQNHGFAVDVKSLSADWIPYFINLNDHTNEGIKHLTKPFYSVQFHPEASSGPWDTKFLYDIFYVDIITYSLVTYHKPLLKLLDNPDSKELLPGQSVLVHNREKPVISPYIFEWIDKKKVYRKVLIIGSGPLEIGQAGEFDYSGYQAIKALKEENIKTILVNPNISTIQTRIEGLADKVYLIPLTLEAITDVLIKERPDGILLGFGGQTALNLGIKLHEEGILEEYRCNIMGTPISTIIDTENRDKFVERMRKINEPVAKSRGVCSYEECVKAAREIGYPVMVKTSYALGGMGSGFCENEEELEKLCKSDFLNTNHLLIERDLRGWKEIEYEVVRDMYDNCITPSALENINPMGIHTGDSFIVSPVMTITDREFNLMRRKAIKIVRDLGIVGECNIQFAINPKSLEIFIIEINARLSRSSALASKATCYPLAYVSAKLALGYPLPKVPNIVTSLTTAFFEPSLDYVVVKIPRWDLVKFNGVSRKLGTSMKSIGEVMSIGRNFEEAFQKGLRMIDQNVVGFYFSPEKKTRQEFKSDKNLEEEFKRATDRQIFAIFQAIYQGWNIEKIAELTKIDKWYLSKFEKIVDIHRKIESFGQINSLPISILKEAKQNGFSDKQIGVILKEKELSIRKIRIKNNILPYIKKIDTLGGEFPCVSNNLYLSYNAKCDEITYESSNKVIVCGSGTYRIGSSLEFDWCGVELIKEIKQEMKMEAIMINNNPETVSTDYVNCDRLYFEEITLERLLDIYEKENPKGMVISCGGQLPINLAVELEQNKVNLIGSSTFSIDNTEDRANFSSLCSDCKIVQPEWIRFNSVDDGLNFANKVGYPIIVRPSYVSSGSAMKLIFNKEELNKVFTNIDEISPHHSICVTKFIEEAKEVDVDGVAQKGKIIASALIEHIEYAGIHSGDSTFILPSTTFTGQLKDEIMKISQKLCNKLNVNGPFNLRLLFSKGMFYVIEMNLRASRSFPFISKTLGINFINLAAKIMLSSKELLPIECDPVKLGIEHVAIKYPKFSFKRLGCDPVLGLEMSSTGEVGCLGYDQYDALLKALLASDFMIPEEGSNILLISENAQEIEKFSDHVNVLHRFNYNIYYYSDKNSNEVHNLVTEITYEKAVKMLNDHQIKLIISFANISPAIFEETPQSKLRKLGLVFNCSFIYSCEVAMRFCDALDQQYQKKLLFDSSLQDYHNVEVLISPEKISSKIIPNKLLTPAENFIKRKKYLIEALSEKQKN